MERRAPRSLSEQYAARRLLRVSCKRLTRLFRLQGDVGRAGATQSRFRCAVPVVDLCVVHAAALATPQGFTPIVAVFVNQFDTPLSLRWEETVRARKRLLTCDVDFYCVCVRVAASVANRSCKSSRPASRRRSIRTRRTSGARLPAMSASGRTSSSSPTARSRRSPSRRQRRHTTSSSDALARCTN